METRKKTGKLEEEKGRLALGLPGWAREEMRWWVRTMCCFRAEVWKRGGTSGARTLAAEG